ncbi:MAG: cupin domain-containing protein [Pseudomonadota bacterium]
MIRSIPDLFHPHDPALVEAAMLESRRLHLKGDRADAFAKLLPWEIFNTLPSAERLLGAELKITQRGRDTMFDVAVPRTKHLSERPMRAEALHALCEQGMSLVLNQVERRVPAIAALNAMLERHFAAKVATNCYVSFRRESAFPAHYDDHNVLVLQLHGSKRWFCHGQPYRYPLAGARFPAPEEPGPIEAEILLTPGDLLFLPRGEVHWAEVAGPASMHLSITIQPPRGRSLLRWLGAQADGEDVAREDLSRLEGAEARAARQERLRAMLHRLADGLDLDSFYADNDRAREPMRPFNLGHFQTLQPDMLVLAALRRRVPLPEDGRLALAGGAVTLTGAERAVLALLLARDGWTVAALEAAQPEARQAVSGLARKALVFLFPAD